MPYSRESALRELNGNLNEDQVREIDEGYRIAYEGDFDEVRRMSSVFIDYGK